MDGSRHKQLVGERLRQAREALGLGLSEMARAYGGSDKTKLSHWERGKHYPDPMYVNWLWRTYRVSADWIYSGEMSALPHGLAESLRSAAKASAAE